MQKKNLILGVAISLFLISSVSALNGFGGGFSLSDLLNEVDNSTMILGALFIIFFTLLNFVLSKFFKNKMGEPLKGPAGVVALAMSILMIWGLNKTDMDYSSFFFSIGIPENFLGIILAGILIFGAIILIRKFKSFTLLILGVLFIGLAFSEILYESGAAYSVGTTCIVLWLLWRFVFRRKSSGSSNLGAGAKLLGRGALGTGNWAKQKAVKKWQQRNIETEHAEAIAEDQRRTEAKEQEQAKLINQEIKKIDAYLASLQKNIKSVSRMKPKTPQEAAIIRQELLKLKGLERQWIDKRNDLARF